MPSSRVTSSNGDPSGSHSKMTRRQIAAALVAVPAVTAKAASAQPPAAPQATSPATQPNADSLAKAQDQVREVSERLRKVEIPMALEPAFTFRA